MNNLCQLWLTCKDKSEAGAIAKELLDKRLIACAKELDLSSHFIWKGNIENSAEVLLIMDSTEDLFSQVEEIVAKIHSYETFVLQAVPITHISWRSKEWIEEVLR
ncbi:MAG: divalent cation tolerance protein CutA [Candidatus Saccharimonadales bacterium]